MAAGAAPQRPGYFRIHRTDQGSDVLHSTATGVGRVEEFHFAATGGSLLDTLFDGSERLVSVISRPWHFRQAYLP